ncbi:MAG: putative beta-lysine N-acetyltransferase [Bacillota bacterium]
MSISSVKVNQKYDKFEELVSSDYSAEVKYSDYNQRITVKDYAADSDLTQLGNKLKVEAERKGYSKLWIKVRPDHQQVFADLGFVSEAKIDDYYLDQDAIIMSYYTTVERSTESNLAKEEKIIDSLSEVSADNRIMKLDDKCEFKLAQPSDIGAMVELYQEVFDSYPTPIFEAEYIQYCMDNNLIYGLIYEGDQLVAAASADTFPKFKNAEMTDFATAPQARGCGYATYLLKQLETELKHRDYHTLYTIARATSWGMNKVFKKEGYEYKGRLVQNCNISGSLEDMNLWNKIIE